ncbi:quinohemoprotein amine dehydrogenase subunit alpha [Novosphingobium album (ex Liu et al. 2023)]|uniref:Quinohemoprotein amine dehydrogenase subunit alpha n=1 Tax=Novosphingobium album (ex Liu et al. 2023) TaxID=3031130 RepID=A0ABT5WUN6_9SPHN|nr:quinohemoprotein amine dehydrogenase subunit alpha [Novosphingobium album (ex Liu et al. 2023)]MDE8653582.1 quinohemoprotein amine dehydrogenase subunit alpha [Novosphingobium album (ex Liu et al. 2023)]
MRVTQVRVPWLATAALACASAVFAQSAIHAESPDEAAVEAEAGIPVGDPLVREKCGACHAPDAKGNLSRISWMRTTPEGWAQAIKRMVRLNGLYISPEDSRAVVRSLSASHGLAPEEAVAVSYIPEKRIVDETNIPNEAVRGACVSCHAFGQPLSWRRSKVEWKNLQDLHVALYSQAYAQYSRIEGGDDGDGDGPAKPTNGEVALEYMRKAAPLHTPEWAAWSARQGKPRLAGTWLVTASVPGKGRFVGEMTIAPGTAPDEFRTTTTLRSLADGSTMTRSGNGLVYGGYAWRGRSGSGAGTGGPDNLAAEVRETMHFTPDQQRAIGRWFWGEYHEFGYDVKLVRASAAPAVLAVDPGALKAGSRGAQVVLHGHNLPAAPDVADIGLGSGVAVRKVVSASADKLVLTVDVGADAAPGPRDVAVGGAFLERAFPVYRKVDFLKVTPETGLARLGGGKHAKGFQQFEAIGFDNGADGKANTGDDVAIGPIAVTWSIDEFLSVYYDDDTRFVGQIGQNALFTPASDGPNPERRFGRNNYGDVWVVATAKSEKDAFGKPLSARAYLVVTVPAYQRWDQPELSQ